MNQLSAESAPRTPSLPHTPRRTGLRRYQFRSSAAIPAGQRRALEGCGTATQMNRCQGKARGAPQWHGEGGAKPTHTVVFAGFLTGRALHIASFAPHTHTAASQTMATASKHMWRQAPHGRLQCAHTPSLAGELRQPTAQFGNRCGVYVCARRHALQRSVGRKHCFCNRSGRASGMSHKVSPAARPHECTSHNAQLPLPHEPLAPSAPSSPRRRESDAEFMRAGSECHCGALLTCAAARRARSKCSIIFKT